MWRSCVWQLWAHSDHSELWAISWAHGCLRLFVSQRRLWTRSVFILFSPDTLINLSTGAYDSHTQGHFIYMYCELSGPLVRSIFTISSWIDYQFQICSFFDWQCAVKLVLYLACLVSINCSSLQLIKKGPTVFYTCPTVIVFTNHIHPPHKPNSDPKDMCTGFSHLHSKQNHQSFKYVDLFLPPVLD